MTVLHRPPQRRVKATIYTAAGWLSGVFVLPKLHTFVDFLNGSTGFVKLVDVRFGRTGQEVSFLAIQRDAITVVIPSEHEVSVDATHTLTPTIEKEVSCIFDRGMVHGILHVTNRTRVSDFLMQNRHYFALTDATIALGGLTEVPSREVPIAIINASQLLAITNPSINDGSKSLAPNLRDRMSLYPVAM